MPERTALITGATGQDGALLAAELLKEGWRVIAGHRRGASNSTWRLDYLGISDKVVLVECQVTAPQNLIEIVQTTEPSHVFHLAAESFVADSFKYPGVALDINSQGTLNILEAIRLLSPESRLFCASSSEVFGKNDQSEYINEKASFSPQNPYAISKAAAFHFVKLYRERYGLACCSGILFNHEGPLRSRSFVTRKITYNIARLRCHGGPPMELGDLNAARDWGAAADYVDAMRRMLELDQPQDLVVATGKITSVRQFLQISALAAGFDPTFEGQGLNEVCIDKTSGLVLAKVAKRYFREQATPPLTGDANRLSTLTGWHPQHSIQTLIENMVHADLMRWEQGANNV